jgi:RNA polymerase subunit RPABC4/transcription elongation factor Spt4
MGDLERRRMQAEAIIATPSEYKVCEGCGSILRRGAGICPLCKSYRFDESGERVVAQAKELGSREATTIAEEDWE